MLHERSMMVFSKKSDDTFSNLFLLILRLIVYSNSSFLAMTALSLYGLIRGVTCVPRKRASAVKSLMRYGVRVLQNGLGSTVNGSVSAQ
jgi:hypothetical protein